MRRASRITGLSRISVKCVASPGINKLSSKRKIHFSIFSKSGKPEPPTDSIEWDGLPFTLHPADKMYVATTELGKPMKKGELVPYGNISLSPAATILNYGQGLFEGIKAFRSAKGNIVVFRPDKNFERINSGANSFLMSDIPKDVFYDALDSVIKANSSYIPPTNKGSLYLRPILFGSGPYLGVAPSPEYKFIVYVSPVGNYFPGGKLFPIRLKFSEHHQRAAERGCGHVKAAGNYAPCFVELGKAKSEGFHEVLYLDTVNEKYVEETGASNVFCVTKDGVLRTPQLGTILNGVTRRSVIELAQNMGWDVEECKVSVDDFLTANEAFATGTGASITPIGTISYQGKAYEIGEDSKKIGEKTQLISDMLLDIQFERKFPKGTEDWLYYPYGKN